MSHSTKNRSKKPSILKFAARLFICKGHVVAAFFVCLVAVVACELSIPYLLQLSIDTALGDTEDKLSQLNLFGAALAFVVAILFSVHVGYLRLEAGLLYDGMYRLRQMLYTHILKQPLSYFHREKVGNLIHRVINDADQYRQASCQILSDFPFEFLTVIGVLTLMYVTNWQLASVITIFIIVTSVISYYIGEPLPTLTKKIQRYGGRMSVKLQEVFSGIRTVKSYDRTEHELAHLETMNQGLAKHQKHGGRVHAHLKPVFDLVEMLGVIFIVWFGARLLIQGEMTPGALVAFIAYMELLSEPMGRAGDYYENWLKLKAITERINNFLEHSDAKPSDQKHYHLDPKLPSYGIEFDRLTFVYPGNQNPSLKSVSFNVAPGEIVALTGTNGSGKSTLMDLLLGLHDPSSGQIYIDTLDSARLDPQAWIKQVGIMSQDVFLFHATVAENIAYGDINADREAIERAAEQAALGPLIKKLRRGLDTIVGDHGNKLSGGEKQKIALARLFLKSPKLIILDEPTSALDKQARIEFAALLTQLTKDKTTFIIAHHEEIIQLADRVITLHNGVLVDDIDVERDQNSVLESRKQAEILPFKTKQSTFNTINKQESETSPSENKGQFIRLAKYHEMLTTCKNNHENAINCQTAKANLTNQIKENNLPQTFQLLYDAAKQQCSSAQANLAFMYEYGLGTDKNLAIAASYYQLAAEQNHIRAQNNLGVLLFSGRGVEKNPALAISWWQKAAKQNDAYAQHNLGVAYLGGQGVERNPKSAIHQLEKAANNGYADTMYLLGYIYESGMFYNKDVQTAHDWYSKAADQNHSDAKSRLEQLKS